MSFGQTQSGSGTRGGVIYSDSQVQVHACKQEHTHMPYIHIAQINGLGGVIWFVVCGRGRLVDAVHKDDGSDPPTIIV